MRTNRSLIGGPALFSKGPTSASGARNRNERRVRARTAQEERATTLVQTLLADPKGALAILQRDLKEGADMAAVSTVLDLVLAAAKVRGVDLQRSVEWIRECLFQAGFAV